MKKLILFAIVLGAYLNSFAQFTLKGEVVDDSGQIVEFAQVYLHGTSYGTFTDENGKYAIKNVELGNYILKVSLIGYEDYTSEIFLSENKTIDIVLAKKSIKLNELIIDGTRVSGDMPFTFNNMDKKEIEESNSGVDVPFLLKRLPSVLTTSDAGAGIGYSGIRIRGTDPTRINVTINGIPLNDSESQSVYWVDLPDIAASANSIQVQRGAGSSTNGAGAFGGTINVLTEKVQNEPYLSVEGGLGSYNSQKISAKAGTGLMNNKYSVDVRYSLINSDGYIDRASSALNSFFFSGTTLFKNSSLKFNAIIGKEKTYQAWNGVPIQYINNDTLRTYNISGTDYFSKTEPYDNEVDDYTQNHFQLFYNTKLSDNSNLNLAAHYTRGSGFYEQYKVGEELEEYGISLDGITESDLIRQKWLKNDFYGLVFNYNNQIDDNSQLIVGGAANRYVGDHFGVVDSIVNYKGYDDKQYYYKNTGYKTDANIYAKYIFPVGEKLSLYGDLQYRFIDYKINGDDDDARTLDYKQNYHFFNPKFGLKYNISSPLSTYISFAVAQREPNRSDFVGNTEKPKSETLYDIEAGLKYQTESMLASVNLYNMQYKDQLVLTGQINDVGDPIRTNVDNSYRRGIELELAKTFNNVFTIAGNANFSQNKIKEYTEYISVNYATLEEKTHTNSDISFSPNYVAGIGADLDLFGLMKVNDLGKLNLEVFQKFVGKQYLDNTMNEKAVLDAYDYMDAKLTYSFSEGFLKNASLSFEMKNIFNKKYITNGFIGRVKITDWNPLDDPYYQEDKGDYYNYIGLFPQALRNFMLRLKVDF